MLLILRHIQNSTGTVQGVKMNHYWDVKVSSTGTTAAGYVWIAVEQGNGSGGIQVSSITNLANNAVLVPEGNYTCSGVTGYNWYKFSTAGIASGGEANFRVYFTYTSCSKDSVLFKAGWGCAAYPVDNPCSYPCSAAQVYLKLDPQPSQIQVSMSGQPGNGASTEMCSTDSAIVTINSAQSSNLMNAALAIYPPSGVTVSTPVPVEYPSASGNWFYLVPQQLSGGGYKISLDSIPALSSGIPGTIVNPGVQARQARVKLIYTTDCNISSGTSFSFIAYGQSSCGGSAIGNGSILYSSGVQITGAAATGSIGLNINATPATLLCKDTVMLQSVNTPVGVSTQPGDTVVYTLPAGIAYTGTFVPVSNCTSCTISSSVNGSGNTIVKVGLEPGIPANATVAYHFGVTAAGEGCGIVPVNAYVKRNIGGLICGSIPCTGSSVVIGTGNALNFTLTKPAVMISALMHTAGDWSVDSIVSVVASLTNNSTAPLPANTYVIEFFCGESTTPFATAPFPTAINAGQSASDTISFMIPDGQGCTRGALVTGKIRPGASTGLQCLCSEASFTIPVPLPVTIKDFTVTAQKCMARLQWRTEQEVNCKRFVLESSLDGLNYTEAGTVMPEGSGSTYYFSTPLPDAKVFFRIKAIDFDERFVYTDVVLLTGNCTTQMAEIYPNPAADLLHISIKSGNAKALLFNILGQKIAAALINGNAILDVRALPEGLYQLLVLYDDGAQTVLKVSIKR